SLDQVQLFEELVVAGAKIGQCTLRACELSAKRCVVVAERRDLRGECADARIAVGRLRARRGRDHARRCMPPSDRWPDLMRSFSGATSMNAWTLRASWRR